jgi:hypothetical protein
MGELSTHPQIGLHVAAIRLRLNDSVHLPESFGPSTYSRDKSRISERKKLETFALTYAFNAPWERRLPR